MLKILFGLLVISGIVFVINNIRKANKREQDDQDLYQDLDAVNTELRKADIEEDVVDAKLELKKRREKINKKAKSLG